MTGADDALQPVLLSEPGLGVVIEHEAAALDGRDVLVGVEAEGDEVAKRADPGSLPRAAEGLGGVLHDAQVVLLGDGVEPVAVHRQPGKIDGNDRPGGGRDGGLDAAEVEVARDRVDLDEDRLRPDIEDDVARGNPGKRGGDDLVTGADACDVQGNLHRAGAGIEGAHGPASAIFGEFGLEGLHLRARGDPAGAQHLGHAGDGLVVDRRTGERQEGQGGLGGGSSSGSGHFRAGC